MKAPFDLAALWVDQCSITIRPVQGVRIAFGEILDEEVTNYHTAVFMSPAMLKELVKILVQTEEKLNAVQK